MSPLLKFGSLGLAALLAGSTAAVTLVEGGGFLHGLWLAANTIFTTGFGPGPQTPSGQMVLVVTMLLMAPLWVVTLVGVVETAAWRIEQRRLTGSTHRRSQDSEERLQVPAGRLPAKAHRTSVIIGWRGRAVRS